MLKRLFNLSSAPQQSTDIETWQGWDAWVTIDRQSFVK